MASALNQPVRASVRTLGPGTAQARSGRHRWLMTGSRVCGSSGDDGDAGVAPPAHFLAAAIAWHEASYQALAAEFGITVHCVHVDARLDQQDDAPITSPPERGPRCRIHLAVTVESPASLAEIARLRAAVMARCPAIGFLRAGAALSVGLEHVIPLGRKAAA